MTTASTDPTCHHCRHFFYIGIDNKLGAALWCDGTYSSRLRYPHVKQRRMGAVEAIDHADQYIQARNNDYHFYTLWPGCRLHCKYLAWDATLFKQVLNFREQFALRDYEACEQFDMSLERMAIAVHEGDPRDFIYPLDRPTRVGLTTRAVQKPSGRRS